MEATSPRLQPWARGPFELIRHADGHLRGGEDTDRRIALIGFDNAIEVCIDVFMKLHPKMRQGLAIEKAELDRCANNYHAKIEFLDRYVQEGGISLSVSTLEILWYHQLRNELYHSGNGMVPESHVVDGARDAAVVVFGALFRVAPGNVDRMLGRPESRVRKPLAVMPPTAQNDQMEFLRVFIEFERALRAAVDSPSAAPRPVVQLWAEYDRQAKPMQPGAEAAVRRAVELRNQLVHGRTPALSDDELVEISLSLMELTEVIARHGRCSDAPTQTSPIPDATQ